MKHLGTVLALGVVLAARTACAATYHVAESGDDAGPGSAAAPWRTLQRAAGAVGPGDTVRVADGSYRGFDLRRSGTAAAPIVFVADGDAVRITADNPVTPDGINVENASHVVIDGFVVDGRTRAGVRAVTGAFVTIRRCRLGANGKWGILTGFVDDLLIEDNEAHHSVVEHGIYVGNSGDRPVIRRNHVHANHANGIHINADRLAGGDGTISGALVEANVIHGNGVGGGSGINMDGVVDSVVRNNLLFDNHASGISLYRIDGSTGSTGNLVVNNTVIQASDGRWAINIRDGSTGNRLRNNILYTTHSFRGVISIDAASRPGFASDHNSVRSRFSTDGGSSVVDLAAWQALGYDLHSFVATPAEHFVAPGSDFHLRADSPAIDAGSPSDAPAVDLDGQPRPAGAGVDLGAYEHGAAAVPSATPTPTPLPATATASRTATGTRTATASPTASRTASATASPSATPPGVRLSGAIAYRQSAAPVAGATVALLGAAPRSATTDAGGAWAIADLAPGAWRVQPRRAGGAGQAVSALDAALVLQHVGGLRTLDAEQRLACDVTADGSLSALDAAYLLQRTVGLIDRLPAAVACDSDWLFLPAAGGTPPLLGGGGCQPGAMDLPALAGDLAGQDFRAAVIGDCSANWQPPGGAGAQRRLAADVRLRALRARADRHRTVLLVRAAAPLQAVQATLVLDGGDPVPVTVRPLLAGRGGQLAHRRSADRLHLAWAGPRPLRRGERLALLIETRGAAPTRWRIADVVAE